MRALLLLLVAAAAVVFVVGVIAPRLSRRLEDVFTWPLWRGERKGHGDGGRVGDLFKTLLRDSRRAIHASGDAGRKIRAKLFR
jgi:hypothetical protein